MWRRLLLWAALVAVTLARPLDPWGVFCGKTLCYDVLEVAEDADEGEIRKNYRRLARFWHPDKNPDPNARAKFEAIAKAYEVVGTNETRKKYDYMRKNPAEYYKQYGEHYERVSAPKTNAIVVIVSLFALLSGIHWQILKHTHKQNNKKLIDVIVNDQEGSPLIREVHTKAKQQYLDKMAADGKKKHDKAYKKDEAFRTEVAALVEQMADEDKGFAQPKLTDLFAYQALGFPTWFVSEVTFQVSWFLRHTVQKSELTEADKLALCSRGLSPVWSDFSEDDKKQFVDDYSEKNLERWRVQYGLQAPPSKDKKSKKRR